MIRTPKAPKRIRIARCQEIHEALDSDRRSRGSTDAVSGASKGWWEQFHRSGPDVAENLNESFAQLFTVGRMRKWLSEIKDNQKTWPL